MTMRRGLFVVIVGPTGSGKSVLVKHLLSKFSDIVSPTSCTTRAMRPGEVEGDVYYFISEEEFRKKIDAGEFLEWAQYGGHLYGSLKSEIIKPLEEGKLVLIDMEVQGARQVKNIFPKEELVTVYIDGGDWAQLVERVHARAPISDEELAKRKERYDDELTFKSVADFIITNPEGEIEKSKRDIEELMENLRNRIGLA